MKSTFGHTKDGGTITAYSCSDECAYMVLAECSECCEILVFQCPVHPVIEEDA
jgi:hypothetical protein